jgi:hypothetical protein
MTIMHNHMQVWRGDIDVTAEDSVAIFSVAGRQRSGPIKDVWEPAVHIWRNVQHHEHRRREFGRESAHNLCQRLDPACRGADCDDPAVM